MRRRKLLTLAAGAGVAAGGRRDEIAVRPSGMRPRMMVFWEGDAAMTFRRISVLWALPLALGCAHVGHGPQETKAVRNATLEWRDYTGIEDPEDTLYVLDGGEMGR